MAKIWKQCKYHQQINRLKKKSRTHTHTHTHTHAHREIFSLKEGNPAICASMNEPGGGYTKLNQADKYCMK